MGDPTPSQSFVDVPVTEDGIDTASFLDASEGLVKMFGAPLHAPSYRL